MWLFRGRSLADRAIQTVTNSPVNHVGMAVALDDLPPLLWHAELGRSLPDVWTGKRQRGVQLHLLATRSRTWGGRYGQRAWVRPLVGTVEREHEDRLMEMIDRFDGRAFPTTVGLARQWATGRFRRSSSLETIYCAELVAATCSTWACCPTSGRRAGTTRAASGAATGSRCVPPFALGAEVAVTLEASMSDAPHPELRASDDDRERAADTLRRAAGDGRLTMDELDERLKPPTGRAPAASWSGSWWTWSCRATSAAVGAPQHRMPVRRGEGGARWLVAIMGGCDRKGRWRLSERITSLNIMGGADLDLNEAELADDRVELTSSR